MQFGDVLLWVLLAAGGGAFFYVVVFGSTRVRRSRSRSEVLNEQYEQEIKEKRRKRSDG